MIRRFISREVFNTGRRRKLAVGLAVTVAAAAIVVAWLSPPSVDTKREIWDAYYIQGAKVGYGRTTIAHLVSWHSGQKTVRIEGFNHLEIKRSGETAKLETRFTSNETPDGRLIDFETQMLLGPAPIFTRGRVDGDKLLLETKTQDKTSNSAIPWSPEYGGFYATEQSLAGRPMKPGERRTFHALMAGFHQVAAIELVACDFEPVKLLSGHYNLLRIDTKATFSNGQSIPGHLWTDRTGEVLKTYVEAMQQETFRTTKAEALDLQEAGEVDLVLDVAVPVDGRLPDPHHNRRIRYRIHMERGDPSGVFVAGPGQRVKSIDPNTAEVTVYALRPDSDLGNPGVTDDPPGDDDRQPNHLVQSDHPAIVAMARRAAGDEKDPWQVALRLERYVNSLITQKDFSQAFATAAEVADTHVGDCTEHAVLLAALARARGIPARAAIGLVYVDGTRSFGYHMWNELYINGRWIPLDATLAQGGIGAAHLKLAHSGLKGGSAYTSFLPVAQVAGRLQIKILDVEPQPASEE